MILDKLKYIDGKIINGLKYDYNKISQEFNKMLKNCNAPAGLYNPTSLPFNDAKYFVLMSERSSSKTTQTLLFCMCAYKLYGCKTAYVRQSKEQITRASYTELFKVITSKEYNYISHLTTGLGNDIFVTRDSKECYFVKYNDDNKILWQDKTPFMKLMSVDKSNDYKSTYNTTNTDFIVFDEFSSMSNTDTPQDFIEFMQLIATIRRERKSLKILMLSNTISPYNQYLRELSVSIQISKMKAGQHALITAPMGARVYVELLKVGIHQTEEFKATALDYFGFENEALKSLYGGEWEIGLYRHLPHSETRKYIKSNVKLEYLGNYLSIDAFIDGKQAGYLIKPYTSKLKNNYLYVTDNPQYNNERFNYSLPVICKTLLDINQKGALYFSDNETALLFFALVKSILKSKN